MSGDYLVHSEQRLLEIAGEALADAQRLGADAAVAQINEFGGVDLKFREGSAERAVRTGGQALSIAVYKGQRRGMANTQALDAPSIRRAVERAATIAEVLEPDADAGLADHALLAADNRAVEMFAPSGQKPDELGRAALEIEEAALRQGTRRGATVRVDQAAASSTDMRWALATSNGFAGAATSSIQSRACVAIVRHGDAMLRDWWGETERRVEALPDAASIAGRAVERAFAKIGARSISTRTAPVLLDARVASELIGNLIDGLGGNAQHQGSSFLAGSMGTVRLAGHLDLVEDPFEPFGLASRAWDSDGIAGSRRHLVREGQIAGYLLNLRFARKLGMAPTGNADGPGNLTVRSSLTNPGDTAQAMLRKMERGLWVTEFKGGAFNPVSGDFSKAVEGFWIEHGAIAQPVQDVTIAGSLPDMLRAIVAVGADPRRTGAIRTGSLLLESMRVAG